MTPSNANTSGLEVVGWRRVDPNGKTATTDRPNTLYVWKASRRHIDDLVTAASAQAAIDAEKARADRLLEALLAVDYARVTDAPGDWTRATKLTDAALQQEG